MKSHFTFTKGQRNGIFLLVILIILLQCCYFFIDFPDKEFLVNQDKVDEIQNEIDSLRLVEIESRKIKIYPFNPNYITDYKGSVLGMSNVEIDRLLDFRKQNKWINSANQFQEVTKISDSLLDILSPLFKFPKLVKNYNLETNNYKSKEILEKSFSEKRDLNKATAKELQGITGVGEVLSNRIVKYRNKFFGGFIADAQLIDIYGLKPDIIRRLTNEFTVKTPRQIEKVKINSASIDELVTIQHIDYEVAHRIIEERTLKEGFKNLDELRKVKDFPVNKIDIIELYLLFD